MNDLHFIIVNSKSTNDQYFRHELESQVSFEVFQDTDEEDVWNVMKGHKGDMYVYDRCGRLTYYIPFSIKNMLKGQNTVSAAISATYTWNPCRLTCDGNKSSEIEDFVDQVNSTDESIPIETEAFAEFNSTETTTEPQETNFLEVSNATESNETSPAMEEFEDSLNSYSNNYTSNFNDSDSQVNSHNSVHDGKTRTQIDEIEDKFNKLFLLLSCKNINVKKSNSSDELTTNVTFSDLVESYPHVNHEDYSDNNTKHHQDHNMEPNIIKNNTNHHQQPSGVKSKSNNISDRCAEADFAVCKYWKKKQLLLALKCCTSSIYDTSDMQTCRNFGKKRCKKIQSILKCCIKTFFTEATTTTTTEVPVANFEDVVCCKNIQDGKLCRVVELPEQSDSSPTLKDPCHEDEFIDDSTNSAM